jgi:hypothetical protein
MKPEYIQIAITTNDGKLVIMSFVTKDYISEGVVNWEKEASSENINAEILKAGIDALSWRTIEESEIPTDRSFRDAWKDVDEVLIHDMTKVKEIHLARLRIQRNALLEEKDKDWMRAIGQGNTTEATAVETERQALRDFPQTIASQLESATTVAEVKLIQLNS